MFKKITTLALAFVLVLGLVLAPAATAEANNKDKKGDPIERLIEARTAKKNGRSLIPDDYNITFSEQHFYQTMPGETVEVSAQLSKKALEMVNDPTFPHTIHISIDGPITKVGSEVIDTTTGQISFEVTGTKFGIGWVDIDIKNTVNSVVVTNMVPVVVGDFLSEGSITLDKEQYEVQLGEVLKVSGKINETMLSMINDKDEEYYLYVDIYGAEDEEEEDEGFGDVEFVKDSLKVSDTGVVTFEVLATKEGFVGLDLDFRHLDYGPLIWASSYINVVGDDSIVPPGQVLTGIEFDKKTPTIEVGKYVDLTISLTAEDRQALQELQKQRDADFSAKIEYSTPNSNIIRGEVLDIDEDDLEGLQFDVFRVHGVAPGTAELNAKLTVTTHGIEYVYNTSTKVTVKAKDSGNGSGNDPGNGSDNGSGNGSSNSPGNAPGNGSGDSGYKHPATGDAVAVTPFTIMALLAIAGLAIASRRKSIV